MKIDNLNNISFGAKINNIPQLKNISGKKVSLPELDLHGFKAFIGADVFTPSCKIVKRDLLFKDGKLMAIDDFDENNISGKIDYAELQGKTIAPGIFDEHIHGGYGVSFHDSGEAEIRALLKRLAQEGTTAVLATTLPGSAEQIKKQIEIINNIIKNPDEGSAKILGIHLEGPFLNPEEKGVHSISDLMLPTIENYESFNPENVKLVTLAPELDKDYKLTKYLQDRGVIVSAGHSMATAQQLLDAGIKHVTHLFNAMSQIHHRKTTIANEGLLDNDVTAEMLADEATLPVSIMNMIMKLKPKNKLVLISDALSHAGIKDKFMMNGKLILVDENMTPRDEKGTLAGNMRFLHNIAKILIHDTNMSFRNFIRYASINPANTFNVIDMFSIKEGKNPTFSVWDNSEIVPEKTFVQ